MEMKCGAGDKKPNEKNEEMRTMKLLALLITIAFLWACAPGGADVESPEPGPVKNEPAPGLLVAVKDMAYEKFEHFFLATGSVEAVNAAYISPEINGQVKEIHVREGDSVRRGQLLVSLNSSVIESSVAEVETSLELARTIYKKRQGLWEKKIGSEVQYLEARANKESLESKLKTLQAQLDMTQITAPIDGVVDEIAPKEGELAAPGQLLLQLVNLDSVYVNADISEVYVAKVHEGDKVSVKFPTYPELAVNAAIHRIGNIINPQNRTFEVQILLDNRDKHLKPNMIAILELKDLSVSQALVVPSIIIKNDMQGIYLYVARQEEGEGLARKTYVETGMSQGSNTMILKGLTPGEQVIVKGYNLVKNGMKIKIEK
jgi:RND family efflux transporter MFP subunit